MVGPADVVQPGQSSDRTRSRCAALLVTRGATPRPRAAQRRVEGSVGTPSGDLGVAWRPAALAARRRTAARTVATCATSNFNAWQFADANLWASLATHILDAARAAGTVRIARSGAEDHGRGAARAARAADRPGVRRRASGSSRRTRRPSASRRRSQLAKWTFGLITTRDPDETLEQLSDLRTRLGLLLRFAGVVALALAVGRRGDRRGVRVRAPWSRVAGAVGAAGAAVATGLDQLSTLLERSGPTTPIAAIEQGRRRGGQAARARGAARGRGPRERSRGCPATPPIAARRATTARSSA